MQQNQNQNQRNWATINLKDGWQILFPKSTSTQAIGETATHAESRWAVVRRLELAHKALQESAAQEGAGVQEAVLRSKFEDVQRQQLEVLRLTERKQHVLNVRAHSAR